MAYAERVQTVIVDESTGAVVAQGNGYASVKRRANLPESVLSVAPVVTPVTISGTAAVDSVLTAVLGQNWTATGYQWYADGVAIVDATSATYTVTSAEAGKAITVAATGLAFTSGSLSVPE